MARFFNMDNPLFRALGKLADLMILNLLFIICSIPIFTIGASLTAMFYVTLKLADNDEGYIARNFFHSFRQNFKQATIIWLVCLAIGAILGIDLRIMRMYGSSKMTTVLTVALIATLILFLIVFNYVFAVLSKFDNTIRNTVVNSFLMSIVALPYTFLILLLTVGPIIITALNSYTIWYGMLVWILCGFALCTYAKSILFKKIFSKYIPQEEETDPDKWEVEMPEGMEYHAPSDPSFSMPSVPGTEEAAPAAPQNPTPAAPADKDPLALNEDVWAAFDKAVSLDESEDRSKDQKASSDSPAAGHAAGYAPVPKFGADGRVIQDDTE